ncbi:Carboxylesterase [Aquisphaera giovannonii]|uniref:Carboxylesterase n=1 Tax=Aquisphaera giovannonii TaxID=406548 RepID=A0A5B9W0C6_9BACT|nr:alpha/beta hydrolase [Aquisphaera giovannonii]QEH33455.1 Carboxylesterase [Aquisphaera giovannonii]
MTNVLYLSILALAAADAADEGPRGVHRDIAYSDAGGARTRLDVYSGRGGKDRACIVWIHGGAWEFGSKALVGAKPGAFNERGYLFLSVEYRLHPAVSYREQAGDIAAAVRWARDHAAEYGGDPRRIYLMGHSAGAHLAALVATDGRYLRKAGLRLKDLSGVILLDGAGYDIPRQIRSAGRSPRLRALYLDVFGDDPARQADASPIEHVAAGKGIPPFLILHVADRPDSRMQSLSLAERLRASGVPAEVIPAEGKTHMTINRELGRAGDPPTDAVFAFLRVRDGRRSARGSESLKP